ncbi:hypothetical protein ACFL5H_00365 [Candidatus Latescibacterota bacterium]
MPNDPYLKTNTVVDNNSDATAQQYNSLMAEVKAAVEGISTHDVDLAFTYGGGSSGDLLATITITDADPTDDQFSISCTITYTYDANDRLSQVETVFANLGVTVTETYSYTGDDLTGIARALS